MGLHEKDDQYTAFDFYHFASCPAFLALCRVERCHVADTPHDSVSFGADIKNKQPLKMRGCFLLYHDFNKIVLALRQFDLFLHGFTVMRDLNVVIPKESFEIKFSAIIGYAVFLGMPFFRKQLLYHVICFFL